MGEDLLDFARQPAPKRDDRRGPGERAIRALVRPRRAWQLNGRGEKAARRAPAHEEGTVGPTGEEHCAVPARSLLRIGATGIGLGSPGAESRAILGERAGAASGIAWTAEGRADVHKRLREIARPLTWRQRARGCSEFAARLSDWLFHSEKPGQNASDIAVDGRGLAVESDRRYRRRGVVADSGKRAQVGFLAGKAPPAPGDFLRASVQVPGARIVPETCESADDCVDWGGGQVLDRGPFGDEGLIVRRRRLGGCLLQQHFGEPDAVWIRRFPRLRTPSEHAATAVPPIERARNDRLSLCLGGKRAYIGAHALDPISSVLDCVEAMMKPSRGGAKPLAEFTPGLIAEALAARGLGEASLIADWPAIVGERLARHARPIELQWPPRAAKLDPDAPIAPATLVLRVESAFALEAQHSASVIVARANAHLGWRCVDKIAFRQGPLPPSKDKLRPAPIPSNAAEAAARAAASPIVDDGLREAVTRLGARAIDRSARVREAASAQNPKGG
jgi:hypothetical protein